MGASGVTVHNGKRAMHKLGIQVLPSPDMMAIMGAKDTLFKVAMLRIGKSLAFQLRGIKQNKGSSGEGIWITKRQPGSSCTSPAVEVLMGSKDMLAGWPY